MHKNLFETFAKYETIILVGGGTGGHIQPIITIAGELGEKRLVWIGGKNSNEATEAKKHGISFEGIRTQKLTSTQSPSIFLYPLNLLKGILDARDILKKWREESCIFSKGGPGSLAIGIAAWTLDIPLFIHESDTIPGFSNRVLGKIATKVFLGFDTAKKYFRLEKCEVIGQILHRVFTKGLIHELVQNPSVSWKTRKPHILVICGSQGAKSVFEVILDQFGKERKYEWIIALGKLNQDMKIYFEKMQSTTALEWISQEDIASLLQNTNIAITRGSATTLAEIDAFGVKKIIIPLPFAANNHQYWNAHEYNLQGDILLEQSSIGTLKQEIEILCQNSQL